MNENNNPQTIEDALQAAAKAGIEVPTEVIIKAQETANLRREQLEKEGDSAHVGKGQIAAFVEQFNRLYPKFLKTLEGIGDVMISLTQTVLIGVGVPIVLILLMVVEQQRVYRGMALFELEQTLAAFGATVLVICNLLFELLISWREHQAEWQEPTKYQFSFRLLAQYLAYLVGITTDWRPEPKSPALRFKVVLRIITFSILMLALAGSMQSVIVKVGGNWYDAIVSIFTRSTLLEFTTWAGGLLFAIAAVFAAQALSQYVANKTIEIIAILESNIDDKPTAIANAAGLAGAMVVFSYLKEASRQRRQAAAVAADLPDHENIISVRSVRNSTEQKALDSGTAIRNSQEQQLTPTMRRAVTWLKEHPTMTDENGDKLSIRAMAVLAGVSATTLHSAKRYIESAH